MELKFTQYVVKIYNSLNEELAKPWAQEAGVNDYLANLSQLATSISHFPEQHLVNQGVTERNKQMPLLESMREKYPSLSVMRDVSDMAKHGKLTSERRNNEHSIYSAMEVRKDGMFRFLRNVAEIKYSTSGNTYDFMVEAQSTINSLINEYGFNPKNCVNSPIVNDFEFTSICVLYFNHDREVAMKSTRIRFLKNDGMGNFIASTPPIGRVEWHELKAR